MSHRPRTLLAAGLAAAALVLAGCGGTPSTGAGSGSASSKQAQPPAVGTSAPDGRFTTTAGKTADIASLHGHTTVVWFVTTWCPSCQTGTQTMADHIDQLANAGVHVLELKLYKNLGGPNGPEADMTAFAHRNAGPEALHNPNWTFGTASRQLTATYDPNAYLDIYYLLDTGGNVRYINGSPAVTFDDLLHHVARLR